MRVSSTSPATRPLTPLLLVVLLSLCVGLAAGQCVNYSPGLGSQPTPESPNLGLTGPVLISPSNAQFYWAQANLGSCTGVSDQL